MKINYVYMTHHTIITDLPLECIDIIIREFDFITLSRCLMVNKLFNEAAKDIIIRYGGIYDSLTDTYSPMFISENIDLTTKNLNNSLPNNEISALLQLRVNGKRPIMAGGAAVTYAIDTPYTDIDIFVNDFDLLKECLKLTETFMPNKKHVYKRYRSVITVSIDSLPDIQFIFANYTNIIDILSSFDFDYVQCAIVNLNCGEMRMIKSSFATKSHETRQIQYIQDLSYEYTHIKNRLNKASKKGFKLAVSDIINCVHHSISIYHSNNISNTSSILPKTFPGILSNPIKSFSHKCSDLSDCRHIEINDIKLDEIKSVNRLSQSEYAPSTKVDPYHLMSGKIIPFKFFGNGNYGDNTMMEPTHKNRWIMLW